MAKFTGRFISKEVANKEVNRFLEIRNETNVAINTLIGANYPDPGLNSESIKTHFSGTENSFIFDKSTVKAFIELIESGPSNGLRIYLGAIPNDDMETGAIKGAKTLVVVPTKITYFGDGTIEKVENHIFNEFMSALEYPGGIKTPITPGIVDIANDVATPQQMSNFL